MNEVCSLLTEFPGKCKLRIYRLFSPSSLKHTDTQNMAIESREAGRKGHPSYSAIVKS